MILKRFSVLVILRVALLLATLIGFALIFGRADLFFNQIILGSLILLQVYELIRFVTQTNAELAKFLLSIKYSDFTINFSRSNHSAFKALHPAMQEIMEAYQQVKIEKEAQYQYLRLLVKYLKVGIISVKDEDEITLMNPPALALLKTGTYHHWKNIQLNRPQLSQAVENMQDGESRLVELSISGELRRLSVQLSRVRLLNESYQVITLHDIEDEINRSETKAYHKLIRILTHEIMNSVTPISSLSETLLMMLEDKPGIVKPKEQLGDDYLEELAYSLRTIQKRTDGLLSFVEDYRRLTRVVLEEQAAQGILYTEAFLSPEFCGGGDLSAWAEYLAAIREAAEEAEAQDGVILRGIVTAVRHFGPERARMSAACAQETAGDWLVGFGMAGNERVGRTGEYAYAFDMAREAGLRLTSHAGEWDGPQAVADALDHLRVERLGHGVRAVEDDALVDRLAEAGTVLEDCQGYNIALGHNQAWRANPNERLRARGVKVTVSSVDPPFFDSTMTREYDRLAEAFDWDAAEVRTLNRVAAEAAFCDETTRARLIEALEPKDA